MSKKYWLMLEPWSYLEISDNNALLYNTNSGKRLIVKNNPEIVNLLSKNKALITDKELSNAEINQFLNNLKEFEIGDLVEYRYSKDASLNLVTKLNRHVEIGVIKNDIKKYISHPKECNIFINSYCNHSCAMCSSAFKQFNYCKSNTNKEEIPIEKVKSFTKKMINNTNIRLFNILGGDIFSYSEFKPLVNYLNNTTASICYFINWKNINSENLNLIEELIKKENNHIKILIDFPFNDCFFDSIKEYIDSKITNVHYQLAVQSEEEYIQAEEFLAEYKIENYTYTPFYNGSNHDFFKENVFISEEDLKESQPSLIDIQMNKSINFKHLSKLTILSNGKIYSNINEQNIASIDNFKIADLPILNNNWGKLKADSMHCQNCLHKIFCPSIDTYEYAFGTDKLCSIMNN